MKLLKKILKFILRIIKFIFKELFSFFIKLLLIAGIIICVWKYTLGPSPETNDNIQKGSTIEVDLENLFSKKLDFLSGILSGDKMKFYSFLQKLEAIKKDPNISALIFKVDNLGLENAEIEELAEKIEDLRKNNKKIYMYAETMNNKNYSLAMYGDEIVMPPTMTAGTNLIGYYSELTYWSEFTNKLGISFNVVHIGDYKAAGENFVRKTMSKEYRENITQLKDEVYDNFVDNVAKNRKVDKKLFVDRLLAGDFVNSNSFGLKKAGLIDSLKYEFDLKKELGEDDERVIDISEYQTLRNEKKDKIAIIYLEGTIVTDGVAETSQVITPECVFENIDRVSKDKNIKGVVLRINSPGGSALASNIIVKKLESLKSKKPIYVSIGGVAASGGYYIATSGEKIFADKESITGSIGVVSIIPNFNNLTEKLGINVESVKKGEYADLYSLTSKFTKQDEKKIYDASYKIYDEFLEIVANSRKMKKEDVHKIAQGKVWLGSTGKEIGLVDEIGGLTYAIKSLAKDLKLEDYSVVEIKEKSTLNGLVKEAFPFLGTVEKISTVVDRNNELYFKPTYYFPYKIN